MTPPRLFDAAIRAARMARAHDFPLHDAAADELAERLLEVNRSFRDVAIIGHAAPAWAARLTGHPRIGSIAALPEAETLPLAPGSVDLVIHALWLHWANDPVGVLVQSRLALRPDGLLLAPLLGGRTLAELRAVLAEAEAAETGGLSPRVAPMGDIRDLGALLQRAGYAMPVADSTRLTLRYRDIFHLMRDLRAMGETNAMAGRLRRFTRRGLFARAGALYAGLADAEGRIPATFETVWLTGWAPGPGQPRPLRPGSARMRLADALGTREQPLPRGGDGESP
ncbi:MAG: SAM-dependent methyltransferase [Paracoccaceae bacterium]|nr:MAG: SAM-dependent methyltransferase [Paracoccaceae bacterium]